MHQGTHALIGAAKAVTVPVAKPVISFSPVVLPVKNRPLDLEVRVTVPATGSPLPIILLAHGHGRSNWLSSLEGYAPLSEFWAAHGFAVLQPTHLRSAVYGLKAPPGNDMFWKDGPEDMSAILDNLDSIEDLVPGLKGRLDRSRVAVAGHSAGAQTASLLLGAKNKDPREDFTYHRPESRVKAGLLLACLGNRGNNLNDAGKKALPWYDADYKSMNTPTLVVCGGADVTDYFTIRGADWHEDAYNDSQGPKDMLTLSDAKHILGGISGWDSNETSDESPERVALVQRMTWAYLWSQLYEDKAVWENACREFETLRGKGTIRHKS